jgi:hypothetical protein
MNTVRFSLRILTLVLFAMAFAAVTQAQATRTWVSGVGDDVNPCSRTAPCKTFAGAISKTAASGEIDCLDPGGFGAVTITKSITIDGTTGAGFGGILASLTNGVIVNDASSGAPNTSLVILRNLSINGAGNGLDGIRFLSARRLIVEGCTVFGFTGDGLETAPSTGTLFNLTVANSTFERNAFGIRQGTAIGTLNAGYDNVNLSDNTSDGLIATGGTGSISRSVAASNGGSGINVSGGSVVNASDCQIHSNIGSGVNNASSTVRYTNNNIYRNGTGISGVGTHQTFNNNKVIGNATDIGAGVVLTNVVATNQK